MTGLLFLAFALVATVAVFLIIRNYSLPTDVTKLKEDIGAKVQESLTEGTGVDVAATSTAAAITDAGIPLKDLSLEGAQQKALEVAGIDTNTFVISKEMVVCAETKLGSERIAAFIAGETPSVLEVGKLIPCLSTQ